MPSARRVSSREALDKVQKWSLNDRTARARLLGEACDTSNSLGNPTLGMQFPARKLRSLRPGAWRTQQGEKRCAGRISDGVRPLPGPSREVRLPRDDGKLRALGGGRAELDPAE